MTDEDPITSECTARCEREVGCQRHNSKGSKDQKCGRDNKYNRGNYTEVGFMRKLDLALPSCRYQVQRVAMAIARHSLMKGCAEYSLLQDVWRHEPEAEHACRHVALFVIISNYINMS